MNLRNKDTMKNWVQLVVTANNVQGVQTICIGQFVSFCRDTDERVLIAGKDLAYCLGFVEELVEIQAELDVHLCCNYGLWCSTMTMNFAD